MASILILLYPDPISLQESPPRDMSKKESKMRAIFGSPSKDELHWQDLKKTKERENLSAFKQPLIKQGTVVIIINDYYINDYQQFLF